MTTFDTWLQEVRRIQTLNRLGELLEWDTAVNMPSGGHGIRAEERGILGALHHERLTNPRFSDTTETLLGDPSLTTEQRACVEAMHWELTRARRVPQDLVAELGRVVGAAHAPWVEARRNNDFEAFAPHLAQIVALKRQEAQALSTTDEPYDGLLDGFDRGTTTGQLLRILDELATGVAPLLDRILGADSPDTSILELPYDEAATTDFACGVIRRMGYDFDRGRLDRAAHPMSIGSSPNDARICTFTEWRGFRMTLFAIMHEAGHALYEQGFDPQWWHTPIAQGISIGVHESQSSIWEIIVGQSSVFWKFYFPFLQERFPFLRNRRWEEMFRAVNRVVPSFIRIDADPLTYDLHIALRVRLEVALIRGELKAEDVPAAWNEGMQELLGITPPSDTLGCLQDVHWSLGYFGYFGAYSLGHLMAAQLNASSPTVKINGQFEALFKWLRENVHRRGRSCTSDQLMREVTGEPLSPAAFLRIMISRLSMVYKL